MAFCSLFFFILSLSVPLSLFPPPPTSSLSLSLSLVRSHPLIAKVRAPLCVCNGESRKGEEARSTAREEGDEGRERWWWRPSAPSLPPLLSLSLFLLSVSSHLLCSGPLFFPAPCSRPFPRYRLLDLFRASTIYLGASNKTK